MSDPGLDWMVEVNFWSCLSQLVCSQTAAVPDWEVVALLS